MITIFIQSADRRVNYQPIRYLFNGIALEMNLSIYKALKGVHLISWLMTAEPKGLNKINWEAKEAIGQLRRYIILVIYLQSEELTETCLPSFAVYFTIVYSGEASETWLTEAHLFTRQLCGCSHCDSLLYIYINLWLLRQCCHSGNCCTTQYNTYLALVISTASCFDSVLILVFLYRILTALAVFVIVLYFCSL